MSAEVEGSTRVLYFAMFVGIGLLITPNGSQNAAKYEWWHGFNPDKIADQLEPQDRWYIITSTHLCVAIAFSNVWSVANVVSAATRIDKSTQS